MKSIADLSHVFLEPVLHRQAVCIDATLGRGRDARFFLGHNPARVIAYEIQEEPYRQAVSSLNDSRLDARLKSHAFMLEDNPELAGKVDAIVFNFGYDPAIPSGPASDPQKSLAAIKAALKMLRPKGRMALAFYPHEQGRKEKALAMEFLSSADGFQIIEIAHPFKELAPSLLCIEKVRQEPSYGK